MTTQQKVLSDDVRILREDLADMACGHSCMIASPRGMATNGGCHCLEGVVDHELRRKIHRALQRYRRLVNTLDALAALDGGK